MCKEATTNSKKSSSWFWLAVTGAVVGVAVSNSGFKTTSPSWTSPCEKYPRVLDSFLPTADVEYFKHLYKTVVEKEWERKEAAAAAAGLPKPRRMLEYFSLLKHLQTQEPHDERFEEIVSNMHKKVEKQFGPGFVIANDFWSWRTPTNRAAERVHMDADFWMADGNDGFNLWMLLDHHEMPYSFDIFTKDENPELYKILGLPHSSSWYIPEEDPEKAKECPGIIFWEPLAKWPVLFEWDSTISRALGMAYTSASMSWWIKGQSTAMKVKEAVPTWAFRVYMAMTGWLTRLSALPAGLEVKAKRFDLDVGDALVVRQHELHGTDEHPLEEGQYRLAIGFKFVRQGSVTKYSYTSPASKSRRLYPGLRVPLGEDMFDPYLTETDMNPWQETGFMEQLSALSAVRFTNSTA